MELLYNYNRGETCLKSMNLSLVSDRNTLVQLVRILSSWELDFVDTDQIYLMSGLKKTQNFLGLKFKNEASMQVFEQIYQLYIITGNQDPSVFFSKHVGILD